MSTGIPPTITNVVCPFCSLLCDDLTASERNGRLKVGSKGCRRAARGFEYVGAAFSPQVGGKAASLDEAFARSTQILRKSRQPLIAGMGTDVRGCQAALALAERCGAIVDHMHGAAAMSNALVLQSRGWMQTTLTELRNRADLIVFVGTDTRESHPRFYERCVWPQDALLNSRLKKRQIIYIGNPLKTGDGTSPGGRRPQVIACGRDEMSEILGILLALQRGREPTTDGTLTGRRLASLRKLLARLRAARYGVFVWSAAELDPGARDLVIHAICDLVVALNESTRFAGLALGGNDGGASCTNVTAWQSGYPGRVNFAGGAPQFDPHLHDATAALESGAVDALLWISSFEPDPGLPARSVPTIALTRPSRRIARTAEVYIPIGTPGVDHAGTLFRTDAIVSLPLRGLRTVPPLSVHEALTRIRERL